MPTSRTRRNRNRSNADRKRERARKARADRAANDRQSFVQVVSAQFTEADWARIRESERVAAEGNLDKALEIYDGISAVVGEQLSRGMRQLQELGVDAPKWAWSRWILEQAFSWDSPENERRSKAALVLALEVAYSAGDDSERRDGFALEDLVTLVIGRDWIARQMMLYELGGLVDFVVHVAGADLLDRADSMIEWIWAPIGAYQQIGETSERTLLLDLETEEHLEVLNIGSLGAVEPGGFVLGRVVPISSEPGLMFESRPLEVDEVTARRFAERLVQREEQLRWGDCGCEPDECDSLECDSLAEEPPRWWEDLRDACDEGRLPPLFSLHHGYPLVTDIPVNLWRHAVEAASSAELVDELVEAGCSRSVAEAAQVCVLGLVSAPLHGKGLTAAGPIYGAALLEPGVINVLRERFALPGYSVGWLALAELVVEPARTRCLSLAEECSRTSREDSGFGL